MTDYRFDTLAQDVANILAKYDVATSKRWLEMFQDSPTEPVEVQLARINAFWRLQLGLCQDSVTVNVREHLLDRCEVQDWLRLFEQHVATHIIHLGLPVPHAALELVANDPAAVFKFPL